MRSTGNKRRMKIRQEQEARMRAERESDEMRTFTHTETGETNITGDTSKQAKRREADPAWEERDAPEDEPIFDPDEHTVGEVNDYLDGARSEEVARVLDVEAEGQARKGIIEGPHAS